MAFFRDLEQKKKFNLYGNAKDPNRKAILRKKMKWEESGALTSDYTTKLQ